MKVYNIDVNRKHRIIGQVFNLYQLSLVFALITLSSDSTRYLVSINYLQFLPLYLLVQTRPGIQSLSIISSFCHCISQSRPDQVFSLYQLPLLIAILYLLVQTRQGNQSLSIISSFCHCIYQSRLDQVFSIIYLQFLPLYLLVQT